MSLAPSTDRHIGFWGATGLGVGAIVGGGILALAGVALAATGPSAVLAFALNGLIALLTALSFAELASAFPQSGGTYVYAKKVLSVEAAFCVGWVVWFASIVAAVLYAIGFGYFAVAVVQTLWPAGLQAAWFSEPGLSRLLSVAAVLVYTASLVRKAGGDGHWANIGKLFVFALLIAGGMWALAGRSGGEIRASMTPFFAHGVIGLFQAMGFTFIALQGFDLIAAAAGEVRQPERNIPRAMFASLGIALVVYLPLLFLIITVGTPAGIAIGTASAAQPETIVAIAAEHYLGKFGFWLVMVAAILSMLSALRANLFAASRVAAAMAGDRTLPGLFARRAPRFGTPVVALGATAAIVTITILVIPNVSAAGAASSLVFLITFALVHVIAMLARRRSSPRPAAFRMRCFPLVTGAGLLACIALAIFQGVAVPSAGSIATAWLGVGGILFLGLFARRARIVDATNTALNPELVKLRGHSPLVLVPIANPENARALVTLANALAPPDAGRVLLLTVVVPPENWQPENNPEPFSHAQAVLGEAITESAVTGTFPETLTTIARHPWREISRVAKEHRCESLLLGLSTLSEDSAALPLSKMLGTVDANVVVLRAHKKWQLTQAQRVLVPIGGRGGHDLLLARLLGVLSRSGAREVTFLRVVPAGTEAREIRNAQRETKRTASDQFNARAVVKAVVKVVVGDPVDVIAEHAGHNDLVVLGMGRLRRKRQLFGHVALDIARKMSCPLIVISRR